jgi:integrase
MTWELAVERFAYALTHDERSKRTSDHYKDDLAAFERWWSENRNQERLIPSAVVEEDIREWKRSLSNEPLNDSGFTKPRWDKLNQERRAKGQDPLPPFVERAENGGRRKPAAVNAKLAALKSFLTWCQREGIIATVPMMPRRAKLAQSGVKWLEPREQNRLLRELRYDRNAARNLPMVEILLNTGLRVAELVELNWGDVVLTDGGRKGELSVRAGKGCKPRTIPLTKTARDAFRRLEELNPRHKPTDAVFSSQRRARITISGVQEVMSKYGVHAHQLRHSFGMALQKQGRPFPEIARLMGHSSVVTTMQNYSTPSSVDLRSAVESIDTAGDDD